MAQEQDALTSEMGEFSAPEMGFPNPAPSAPGGLPPGKGGLTTPNFLTFSALVRSAAKAYLQTSDEALRDSPANARAMRRDPVLMGALRKRQRKTAQISWSIEPDDETDPAQTEAAQLITHVIEAIPKFQKLKMMLLEAIWFGHYAVEVAYEWREHQGKQVLFARDFIPINGDKIRFRWDGVPGFLVMAAYPGKKDSTDYGLAHFVTPDERQQYIIHEHEPDDADWIEPEMAGAIHGVGVRGRLYWFWWLKQQVFAQLMNYIHRFANGLTIFYYNASDKEAKEEAITAARQQFSSTALIYPRWNTEKPDTNKVERLEVGTASPTLIWNLVDGYFDPIMVRYIMGQTISMDHTGSGGLGGSGVADLAEGDVDEIVKYDAVDLGETLQTDLVNVLYSYNAPGIKPGKFKFQVDSPNSKELMTYGQILFEWGVPLSEEQAYKISQWEKPKPGEGIISQLGAMQPSAVGGAPTGVPVAGAAGPPGQPPMDPNQQAAMMQAQGQAPPPQGAPPPAMAFKRNGNGKPVDKKRILKRGVLPSKRVVFRN